MLIELIALIVSLLALLLGVRNDRVVKQSLKIQTEAHDLNKRELLSKQAPKLQITNETFMSTWQINPDLPPCLPDEIDLVYTSQLTNKGENVTKIESIIIEVGPAPSPLENPKYSLGYLILGNHYLSSGESMGLNRTIGSSEISMARMFFENFIGVLVFNLVFKFSSYGEIYFNKYEIYRMDINGGIVSKGNYNAAAAKPRSYLLEIQTVH